MIPHTQETPTSPSNKKQVFIVLFSVFVLLTILSCSLFQANQGYVIYQAVDNSGERLPELVVLDPSGEELRRITLLDEQSRFFPYQLPTSRHALYHDFTNARWLLIDVTSGEVQEFSTFGQAQEEASPCGYASDWIVFCGDLGKYLLAVESGNVSEIPVEIDPARTQIPSYVALISPDESHFLLLAPGGLWLVPAATPESARRLGNEQGALNAVFSEDSDFILYTQPSDTGDFQVIREKTNGSNREILLTAEDIREVAFIPGQNQIIVVHRDSVTLFSIDTQEESLLFTPSEPICQIFNDSKGEKAAFGTCGIQSGSVEWTYVDLEKRTTQALAELDGYRYVQARAYSRWLFLTDNLSQDNPMHVASLDLESGQVHNHLLLPEERDYAYLICPTENGQICLVIADLEDGMQIWLLTAEEDGAVLLAEASLAVGSLSPNGQWVVLGIQEESGDQIEYTISIVATSSGEETSLAKGYRPVWVWP